MGTKSDPGDYDCYAEADPDEPIFVLRAKDPMAPVLVRAWAAASAGRTEELRKAFADLQHVAGERPARASAKLADAMAVARAMERWHDEQLAAPGCGYAGRGFGADYDDAVCIAGWLWDADSCDEPGGPLHHGGEIPCPACNTAEHIAHYAEEVTELGALARAAKEPQEACPFTEAGPLPQVAAALKGLWLAGWRGDPDAGWRGAEGT